MHLRLTSLFIASAVIACSFVACSDELGPGDDCEGSPLSSGGHCPTGYFCNDHSTPWRCEKYDPPQRDAGSLTDKADAATGVPGDAAADALDAGGD